MTFVDELYERGDALLFGLADLQVVRRPYWSPIAESSRAIGGWGPDASRAAVRPPETRLGPP